jgi:hypothetical protein
MEDEHLLMASIAIDKDAEPLQEMNTLISSMMPGLKVKPFDWLGSSITFFAEKGGFWTALEKAEQAEKTELSILFGAPFGIRIEHSSKVKLASFLIALKAMANQAAPNSLKWSNKEHGGETYVIISSDEEIANEKLSLYYVITKDQLILTLQEDVIKREIDRQKVEKKMEMNRVQENGDHFYMKSTSQMLMTMTSTAGDSLTNKRRMQSYRAIPILNEWKRKFKEGNPTEIHFAKFGEDIFCPGGKGYVWNEKEMTMESVVYGHPAAPKKLDKDVSLMDIFGELESSMKFEHDGIRVGLKITKGKSE